MISLFPIPLRILQYRIVGGNKTLVQSKLVGYFLVYIVFSIPGVNLSCTRTDNDQLSLTSAVRFGPGRYGQISSTCMRLFGDFNFVSIWDLNITDIHSFIYHLLMCT